MVGTVPSVWGRCQAGEGCRAGAATALQRAPPRGAEGHTPREARHGAQGVTQSIAGGTQVLGGYLQCSTLILLQGSLCGNRAKDNSLGQRGARHF